MNLDAVARRAGAVLATAALVVVGGACVAPPSEPEVDTALIDEPVEVDPGLYTVRIRSQTCEGLGVGSGFLVDGTTIVTNRHVVEGAEELEVETSEGVDLTVAVADQGLLADLAVVRLATSVDEALGEDAPHAALAPANPEEGDDIRAVGYPEGGALTITEGEVETFIADPQLGNLSKVIRSDVEVHPGNSGGPAIDEQGQVIGVVYALESASGKALIVPVDTVRRLLDDDAAVETVTGC